MIGRLLFAATALVADWERVPVCDWCRSRCRSLCPAAKRIADLEWELERVRGERDTALDALDSDHNYGCGECARMVGLANLTQTRALCAGCADRLRGRNHRAESAVAEIVNLVEKARAIGCSGDATWLAWRKHVADQVLVARDGQDD